MRVETGLFGVDASACPIAQIFVANGRALYSVVILYRMLFQSWVPPFQSAKGIAAYAQIECD